MIKRAMDGESLKGTGTLLRQRQPIVNEATYFGEYLVQRVANGRYPSTKGKPKT